MHVLPRSVLCSSRHHTGLRRTSMRTGILRRVYVYIHMNLTFPVDLQGPSQDVIRILRESNVEAYTYQQSASNDSPSEAVDGKYLPFSKFVPWCSSHEVDPQNPRYMQNHSLHDILSAHALQSLGARSAFATKEQVRDIGVRAVGRVLAAVLPPSFAPDELHR